MFSRIFLFSLFVSSFASAELSVPKIRSGPYNYMSSAPEPIAKAGKAVVRLSIGPGSGTGFFISNDGLLLTNDHVLGAEDCPYNGCFVEITRNFTGEASIPDKAFYFVTPKMRIPEIDVNLHQVWDAPPTSRDEEPSEKLETPDFLEFSEKGPELSGDVFVVGFPKSGVQRWSQGPVRELRGDRCGAEVGLSPGSSGSPALNSEGKIIGIVHSGACLGEETTDIESRRHVSFFTSSLAYKRFADRLKEDEEHLSLDDFHEFPAADVVSAEDLVGLLEEMDEEKLLNFMQYRRQNKIIVSHSKSSEEPEAEEGSIEEMIAGAMGAAKKPTKKSSLFRNKPVLEEFHASTLLGKLCEQELSDGENANDMIYDYPACQQAVEDWIECRKEEYNSKKSPIHGLSAKEAKKWEFRFCPSAEEQKAWKTVFKQVEEYIELKSEDTLAWVLATAGVFETSEKLRREKTKLAYEKYLESHTDLNILEKLTAVAQWTTSLDEIVADGKSIRAVLSDYQAIPERNFYMTQMVMTYQLLSEWETKEKTEVFKLAEKFLTDKTVPFELKLSVESALSNSL